MVAPVAPFSSFRDSRMRTPCYRLTSPLRIATAALVLSAGSLGAQTAFVGSDADRNLLVSSAAAEAAFKASLTTFGTETFAGDVLAEPQPLVFGAVGTGLLTDPDPFAFNQISSGAGTFGIPGRTSYHTGMGGFGATPIVFTFDGSDVNGFGLYAVGANSIGGAPGALSLQLDFFDGALNVFSLPVNGPFITSENAIFAGVSGITFDRVEVRGQNGDGISFNDVTIGTGIAAVPEPATVALVATGLLAVGAAARRRRA
jgi:hypothetical protein